MEEGSIMAKIYIDMSGNDREEIRPVAFSKSKMSDSVILFKFLVPMTYQSGYNTLALLAADELSFMLVFGGKDDSFNETFQNCTCSFGQECNNNCWIYITSCSF
jgi:hypothetical protein